MGRGVIAAECLRHHVKTTNPNRFIVVNKKPSAQCKVPYRRLRRNEVSHQHCNNPGAEPTPTHHRFKNLSC